MIIYTYARQIRICQHCWIKPEAARKCLYKKKTVRCLPSVFFFRKRIEHNLPDTDLGLTRDEIVNCVRERAS